MTEKTKNAKGEVNWTSILKLLERSRVIQLQYIQTVHIQWSRQVFFSIKRRLQTAQVNISPTRRKRHKSRRVRDCFCFPDGLCSWTQALFCTRHPYLRVDSVLVWWLHRVELAVRAVSVALVTLIRTAKEKASNSLATQSAQTICNLSVDWLWTKTLDHYYKAALTINFKKIGTLSSVYWS